MKILIDILHPAHVHFFRNFAREAIALGHQIRITSRGKEMTTSLLDAYGLEHRQLTDQSRTTKGLAVELVKHTAMLMAEVRRFQPDVMMGIMAPCIALARILAPARALAFYDNETARTTNQVVYRLCDAYLSPTAFRTDLGPKQIRYPGYHEMAYLHPRWFEPRRTPLERLALNPNERLFLVRFVGWWASHDRGEQGFTEQGKIQLVRDLAAAGRVIVSSEAPLPAELQDYAYKLPPEDMHHVLAYADLFVGESSTMASEACLLGTHSVYVSKTGRGINDEQAQKISHTKFFSHHQENEALNLVRELCKRGDLKAAALAQRQRMIKQSVDPTTALLNLVSHKGLTSKTPASVWRQACQRAFAPSTGSYWPLDSVTV